MLPPTIGVTEPNPKADFGNSPFYVSSEARPWLTGGAEHPRGDQADAQPGVRAGADADGDLREVAPVRARLGQQLFDGGREQFGMTVPVDTRHLGEHPRAVMERHRDRWRRGVKS